MQRTRMNGGWRVWGTLGICSVLAVPVLACPPDITVPYRGVVEGSGVGFEGEIDTPPADQEVLSVLDIAHGLMSGRLSVSAVGLYTSVVSSAGGRGSVNEATLEAFETHLEEYAEDWYTMREYALALILDKQYEAGFEQLKASYLGEPALVRMPMDQYVLGNDLRPMKKLTARLVRYAKAKDSGEAWFLVTVILQAQGELKYADKSLDRAIEDGFDEEFAASMHEALTMK